MGYTHYWYRYPCLSPLFFEPAVKDIRAVLKAAIKGGILLAGWQGLGGPKVTDKAVTFNGPEKCGHPREDFGITWPAPQSGGVGRDEMAGTWFAGALLQRRRCGGDCSHETFHVPQKWDSSYRQPDEQGRLFSCCKTAFKPYDLAVTAALIVFKHHFGSDFIVQSDGEAKDWFDGALLVKRTLGYGLDFKLDVEEEA